MIVRFRPAAKGDVMTSTSFVLLSGAVTLGVPLYLAVRAARGIRPGGRHGGRRRAPDPVPPRPDSLCADPNQKKLPDCLIPGPTPHAQAPADRALEPA